MSESKRPWAATLCGALLLCAPAQVGADPPAPPSTYARIAAVVVGVGTCRYSQKWASLKNAEHDALNFARVMRSFGGKVTTLSGARATRRNIINGLDDAAADLRRTSGGIGWSWTTPRSW